MTVRGKIRKEDLGAGVYLLVADDGTTYSLVGGDRGLRKAGLAVVVEGDIADDVNDTGMTGAKALRVRSWKAA